MAEEQTAVTSPTGDFLSDADLDAFIGGVEEHGDGDTAAGANLDADGVGGALDDAKALDAALNELLPDGGASSSATGRCVCGDDDAKKQHADPMSPEEQRDEYENAMSTMMMGDDTIGSAAQQREWDRHTEAYQAAMTAYAKSLSVAVTTTAGADGVVAKEDARVDSERQSTAGGGGSPAPVTPQEAKDKLCDYLGVPHVPPSPPPPLTAQQAEKMMFWAQREHPRLCCALRHQNYFFMLS